MDIRCPIKSLEGTMRGALERLALLRDAPAIAKRDPLSAMSFSCCEDEAAQVHIDMVRAYGKDQSKAFSPLGSDGRPVRKYVSSDRHQIMKYTNDCGVGFLSAKSIGYQRKIWMVKTPRQRFPLSLPPYGWTHRRLKIQMSPRRHRMRSLYDGQRNILLPQLSIRPETSPATLARGRKYRYKSSSLDCYDDTQECLYFYYFFSRFVSCANRWTHLSISDILMQSPFYNVSR